MGTARRHGSGTASGRGRGNPGGIRRGDARAGSAGRLDDRGSGTRRRVAESALRRSVSTEGQLADPRNGAGMSEVWQFDRVEPAAGSAGGSFSQTRAALSEGRGAAGG